MRDPEVDPAVRRAVPRISLLDADQDLLGYLSPEEAEHARRAVTAPLVVLPEGPFDPVLALAAGRRAFGGLILTGLVTRELSLGSQPTLMLLGAGDLLHVRPLEVSVAPAVDVWSASLPTRVALLDDHFLQAVLHWPRLLTALFERAADRTDSALLQLAASHHPRVEDRLVALFSMLAERWGRVTADGVAVPLALTHEALARLVGARRPTVTLALKQLAEDGRVTRRGDGAWVRALDTSEPPRIEPLGAKARPRLVIGVEPEITGGPVRDTRSPAELRLRAKDLAAVAASLRRRADRSELPDTPAP